MNDERQSLHSLGFHSSLHFEINIISQIPDDPFLRRGAVSGWRRGSLLSAKSRTRETPAGRLRGKHRSAHQTTGRHQVGKLFSYV